MYVSVCTVAYRGSTHWGGGGGTEQWRNEPKHLGGGIFARERSDQARGSVATERGEGGVPPPTVGNFFIFRLENVQSGAYLRRKFRLDDMYYMGKRVTIRPTGKRVFFSWTRKHNYENMHPKIIFAKFQTHANVIPNTKLLIIILFYFYILYERGIQT